MTNLKRIIDEKGVRQRWLAEQVGVTEVSMSRYVSGERIPKAPLAIRMADVLGVDVKELYGWDDKHVVGEPEQPETHEKRTETHACDLTNSQQAINLLKGLEQSLDDYCELNDEGKAAFRMAITALELFGNSEQLPSAQPEITECPMCPDCPDNCPLEVEHD